jgi:hypothetical protein
MPSATLSATAWYRAIEILGATSVARWFIFEPKISIWEHFGGGSIGKCLHILRPFGIFYGDLGYFMTDLHPLL